MTGAVEKGDISGQPTPRLLFVFEGLLGIPPHRTKGLVFVGARAFGRQSLAVAQWDLDPVMVQQLWDLFWRHSYRFDVVTFMGPQFAVALHQRLEQLNVPISHVITYPTPDALASALAVMPDVAAVYDGDPHRKMAFGSKGRYVSDPSRSLLALL